MTATKQTTRRMKGMMSQYGGCVGARMRLIGPTAAA
eukprot:CAMPEP_0206050066 /NCGR_PEP_ID=MMETSP1466-20131121/28292_1 /ASSEMBLY_ACC=CAM_ASM_001126 /TAXON_ID=44452 /ORGANISM="Pavlova gyrans, Strain CCMP608" /LENGTH=35 /DNA_ID= /DNA_START= /DNA_END= /DNA_ORIENTATION=